MSLDRPATDRMSLLAAFADRIYEARRSFLREAFDGYVADTYYVVDAGYYCWPAVEDGSFVGYTELVPAEERVVADLEARGFELVGVGLGRVVCALPDADVVVKFGRCGMTDEYGDGRHHNLVEDTLSKDDFDLPVVPCRYCSPRGEFALYPRADPVEADDPGVAAAADRLREALTERVPVIDAAEATRPENLGRWRGEIHLLDYCKSADSGSPVGVPDHVDGDRVVEAVDRRRQSGEKPDLRVGGGYASDPPGPSTGGRTSETRRE